MQAELSNGDNDQKLKLETGKTHAFRKLYNQLLEPGQLVNAFIDPA